MTTQETNDMSSKQQKNPTKTRHGCNTRQLYFYSTQTDLDNKQLNVITIMPIT